MSEIAEVVTNIRPVVVEFQNQISLQDGHHLKSQIFKDRVTNKKIVGIDNGRMVYSGVVSSQDDDLFNNFLGFYDENTQQIKLIQIDTCSVVPLVEKKPTAVTKSPVNDKSVADLRKQFGSKKAKRFTEQQERLTMNIENVKEELEHTVSGIDVSQMNTSTVSNADQADSGYKPKINREASTREEVYLLDDLVPSQVLESLNASAAEILATEDLNGYGFTPFCAENIALLKVTSMSEEEKIRKCQIYLYLHYLAKYMLTPLKSMPKGYVICDCSHLVGENIRNTFTINGQRPNIMRDKILCYLLVLFVITKDYQADIESLAKDLKVGLKKLQEFARALSFTVNKSVLVLKLPLPEYVNMSFTKRKRN